MNRVIRGGLAVLVAIVGYNGVAGSLAPVVARNNIELAARLAPDNGQIIGRRAMSLSGANAVGEDRRRADRLAQRALREDPTAVTAVVALGVNAALRGEQARARRLFSYSQRLSRRNLSTQLWAIEDAVGKGDIAGALGHYDIALRTSPETAELLFPVLTAASADPAVRAKLVRKLAEKPPWSDAFISHFAAQSADPLASATFLSGLRRANVEVPETARVAVVNTLAARGYADAAWAYYASSHPDADRRKSRNPSFVFDIATPSQLDWIPVESPGISASIQRSEQGGLFEYSAPASVGGALLRQLQLLPPGIYRLVGHGSGIDQPDGERPYWLLTCHDGRELGRVELPRSAQSKGRFAGRITVPTGCGIQMLQLIARPANAASGLSGQIDRVQLEPA